MSSIVAAEMDVVIDSVPFSFRIEPEPIGTIRGWETADDFAIDMFRRVHDGDQLFADIQAPVGSDVGVMIPTATGSTETIVPYNSVRYLMLAVIEDAQAGGFAHDGRRLVEEFNQRVFGGLRFMSTDPTVPHVFRIYPQVVAATGIQSVSRNTGVRNGNLSMRSMHGQTKAVHDVIADVTHVTDITFLLTQNPQCRFAVPVTDSPRSDWVSLSVADTIDVLKRVSCVPLGMWMRFAVCPLSDMLMNKIGVKPRQPGAIGGRVSQPLDIFTREPGRLMFHLVRIIAESKGVSPLVYWRDHLGDAVRDVDMLAVATNLKIDIYVISVATFINYRDMVRADFGGTGDLPMIVPRELYDDWRQAVKHLEVLVLFKGREAMETRFRSDKGSNVIMVCSHLYDDDAHVDVIFNKYTEDFILRRTGNHMACRMTYVASDEQSSRGFFTRLADRAKERVQFVPSRRYDPVKSLDFVDFCKKRMKPGMVEPTRLTMRSPDQFFSEMTQVISGLTALSGFDFSTGNTPTVRGHLFGRTYHIDRELVQHISASYVGRHEKGINGLIYVFAMLYRALDEADLTDMFYFKYKPTVSPSSVYRTFARQIGHQSVDETAFQEEVDNLNLDCVCTFDDVSMFGIELREPVTAIDSLTGDECVISNIVRVSMFDAEARDLASTIATMQWVQDAALETRNRLIDIAQRECKGDKEQLLDSFVELYESPILNSVIIDMLAGRTLLMIAICRRPVVVSLLNRYFGTLNPSRDELVPIYDPQIDEPTPARGSLPDKVPQTGGFWEVDANLFYTQTFLGRYDNMLYKDFYGEPWVNPSPKRATLKKFESTHIGALMSYQADMGFVWLTGVRFFLLKTHLGYSEIDSWARFDIAKGPDALERRVPCASIIQKTSELVERLKLVHEKGPVNGVEPYLYDLRNDARMLWITVQRNVFQFEHVYFYHGEDEREVIKQYQKKPRSTFIQKVTVEHRFPDLTFGASYQKHLQQIRDTVVDSYDEYVEHLHLCGKTPHEIKKILKIDFNMTIGAFKYGKYSGSVEAKHSYDVGSADEHGRYHSFGGVRLYGESATQLRVRPLPLTDLVLTDMSSIRLVSIAGNLKWLRVDILERARMVMDILAYETHAFSMRTDAVLFDDDRLEDAVYFLAPFCDHGVLDTDDPIRSANILRGVAGTCRTAGCPPNKLCELHYPMRPKSTSIRDLLPFKFIYHQGLSNDVHSIQSAGIKHMATHQPEMDVSCSKMSPIGRQQFLLSLGLEHPPVIEKTSSYMPTIADMNSLGMLRPDADAQERDGQPTVMDPLELHCHLMSSPFRPVVWVGEPGSAQPCIVDMEARNQLYMLRMFDRMRALGDEGFVMEGPPGFGKSYAVCEFVKQVLYPDPTGPAVIIATATHLTLEPYQSLLKFEQGMRTDGVKRIHVRTIHSLVGVFNDFSPVANDPHDWFTVRGGTLYNAIRNNFSGRKVWIFIDEFEMLQQQVEEIILFFSRVPNTNVVLLGDRYQTAAHGRGMRCDGDAVRVATNGNRIEFDLPFRNTDYEFQMALKKATHDGHPTAYLALPLSQYTYIRQPWTPEIRRHPAMKPIQSRIDKVELHEDYAKIIRASAVAYYEAARASRVFNDPMISAQNYKVVGMVTMDILDEIGRIGCLGGDETPSLLFTGDNPCSRKQSDDSPDDAFGSVDVDTAEVVETPHERLRSTAFYIRTFSHLTTDPSGKGFLVGTVMKYKVNYTYRSLVAFLPKSQILTKKGGRYFEKVRQTAVMMGRAMRLVRIEEMCDQAISGKGQTADDRPHTRTNMYVFEDEDKRRVVLTEAETRAYMYYPFCMFTGGIVGHTFNNYTMVVLSSERVPFYDYADMRLVLTDLETRCGHRSWLSPLCKTLNVVVSRVRTGNTVNIIEIGSGRARFWEPMLRSSNWHLLGRRRTMISDYLYNEHLTSMRLSVVDAMNKSISNTRIERLLRVRS